MKRRDDKGKMTELHQHKVAQMIKSAEGSTGLLHKITKPTAWRGGTQILLANVTKACRKWRISLGK